MTAAREAWEAAGTGSLALTKEGAARGVWHPLRWHQWGQRERQWLSELQGTLRAGSPLCGHPLFPPGGPSKEGGCVRFSWVWSKKPKLRGGWNLVPSTEIPREPPVPPSPPLPLGAVMRGWAGAELGAGPEARAGRRGGHCCCPRQAGVGEGPKRAALHPVVRSSGQPGGGNQRPGCLSWGHQGSGGGERQCRPRGRCGPWRLPGTSACRSQSAVTREAGRERGTRETRGQQRGRRRDQNVSVRCLSPGSGSPRSGPPFGHHPLPGWCGH